MDDINKILEKIIAKFKEENGQDAVLKDGETIHGIFNDAIVTISSEESKINIEIILGKPYIFNEDIDI